VNISEIKVGDRVDYRELNNCEVLRVGRATVWLTCMLPHGGAFPVAAHPSDIRPHVDRYAVKIGDYVVRNAIDGKVWIVSIPTGEAMHAEEAKLESCLAKFWRREF
jgi:hypothetical protein